MHRFAVCASFATATTPRSQPFAVVAVLPMTFGSAARMFGARSVAGTGSAALSSSSSVFPSTTFGAAVVSTSVRRGLRTSAAFAADVAPRSASLCVLLQRRSAGNADVSGVQPLPDSLFDSPPVPSPSSMFAPVWSTPMAIPVEGTAVEERTTRASAIALIKRLPLTLIEEIPLPVKVLTDIELLMTAWSEEQARYYFVLSWLLRAVILFSSLFLGISFYYTCISAERRLRGVKNMPSGLRIGCVVYFDIKKNEQPAGRIIMGLLTEHCPLYCEYFHRRCTGSGGNGDSFRGMKLTCLVPTHAALFGEGQKMTHDVVGFNPSYLPTEYKFDGAWRGALSSISYARDRESPNFSIHISAGDYEPQVFGMVLAGYDVVEKINRAGTTHGGQPKHEWTIDGCGEICTLDKSKMIPLPWRLYETVSAGYDADKYGPLADRALLTMEEATQVAKQNLAETNRKNQKRWWSALL